MYDDVRGPNKLFFIISFCALILITDEHGGRMQLHAESKGGGGLYMQNKSYIKVQKKL